MTMNVRRCSNCEEERSLDEIFCGNCGWNIIDQPIYNPGNSALPLDEVSFLDQKDPLIRLCANGHPMNSDDEICFFPNCGAYCNNESKPDDDRSNKQIVDEWVIIELIEIHENFFEKYLVEKNGCRAQLTYYFPHINLNICIEDIHKQLSKNSTPDILSTGIFNDRFYEVLRKESDLTLLDLTKTSVNQDTVIEILNSIGRPLQTLSENGLLHGNLRPEHIYVMNQDPLRLQLTAFEYRQQVSYDSETSIPIKSYKYQSPEIIAGGASSTSDWWSLGIILLELITRGRATKDINEKAFCIHVVTRGIVVPDDIDPRVRILLQGLLTRDPDKRWSWANIQNWISGEHVEVYTENVSENSLGPILDFKEEIFRCPKTLALRIAEEENWDDGKELFIRGVITTWIEKCHADSKILSGIRAAGAIESLSDDYKFSLALLWMNPNLPLVYRGEIISPSWLLQNPIQGYELINSSLISYLRQMNREMYLCDLSERVEKVREKATILNIKLNESTFRIFVLSTSRANLECQWLKHRQSFPGSDHSGINSLLERQKITIEDLIILLAAEIHQYQSAKLILNQAEDLTSQLKIDSFDRKNATEWFTYSRKEIYREIEARVINYSQCGITRIDEWANDFSIQHRLVLHKALILLSIPKDQWKQPDRAHYISKLLEFFEKKASFQIQRSSLVQMRITKSNSRVDLININGKESSSSTILEHLINRKQNPLWIDRTAFHDIDLEKKFRHLEKHSETYKRNTGIDGLYLGFPFLVFRDSNAKGASLKPKIAPVLLWPIKINIEAREKINVHFDGEREEIRLNPALTKILGVEEIKAWIEIAHEILGRESFRISDIMDAFGSLAELREQELCILPDSGYSIPVNKKQLVCSAVLFHAEFMGQALNEDLKQLKKSSSDNSCMELMLRVNKEAMISESSFCIAEQDKYFTVEADPSQEMAVFKARQENGLLIEGPPGTGKSQTIVNIIGDCIGRKETVLVVCQKAAALEVLAKRLEAEELNQRFCYVTNINKDKTTIIQKIRDQRESLEQSMHIYHSENIERQRSEISKNITRLEDEIDEHHKVVHLVDNHSGLSYRELLGELLDIEEEGHPIIDVPALRAILSKYSPSLISQYEEICAPISYLWLESSYEKSSLSVLKAFSADHALIKEFVCKFTNFTELERKRDEITTNIISSFEIEDPSMHCEWIDKNYKLLKEIDWNTISQWSHLFSSDSNSTGHNNVVRLIEIQKELNKLNFNLQDQKLSIALFDTPLSKLKRWLSVVTKLTTTKPSKWNHLNPIFVIKHLYIKKILQKLNESITEEKVIQFKNALDFEIQCRPIRKEALSIIHLFYQQKRLPSSLFAEDIRYFIENILKEIIPAQTAVVAINNCPRHQEVLSLLNEGLPAYERLIAQYANAFIRQEARTNSLFALSELSSYFEEQFFDKLQQYIYSNISNIEKLNCIDVKFESIQAFQEFRAKTSHLSENILTIFSTLREKEVELKNISPNVLNQVVRNIIKREVRLGWKDRIEQSYPILRLAQEELSSKIKILANATQKMQVLNRKYLACHIDMDKMRSLQAWEDITRLRGPRAKRLREFVDLGWDIGLTELRPVWLMNPDTASQLLPLRAGMFDVVIFDEASQIPIENAIPTLYRAKRTVISGDEKQMPPSRFFTKKIADDEEYIIDSDDPEIDELATETEREELENIWNRREIKDCSDLLVLGKTILPKTMLEIHYRSRYRELIAFSNAAYYGNRLSVPVRHPENVIKEKKPIELIRVDGVYSDQTNRQEAEKIIDILTEYWSKESRPSIGIVTFNIKQADLIEDIIFEHSEKDENFRKVYMQEQDRHQDGEDMSFFIKNVENVQGDERDIIIFSSTFGRDENGVFRRSFGSLSQEGGERRLNVAITRAREKVILITSLPINELSDYLTKKLSLKIPRDYLQAYFDYASKISDGNLQSAHAALAQINKDGKEAKNHFMYNDGFIRSVAEFIQRLGLTPMPIQENDAFGLDLVIEDAQGKRFLIGIECDAHSHPILNKARAREIWRPKVLHMGIPYVHRITSFSWYHQKHIEMEKLIKILEASLNTQLIEKKFSSAEITYERT